MMSWRTFLARVGVATLAGGAALTLAVFAGVRLATADPGGRTRDALTYAGVLRAADGGLVSGAVTLAFTFHKPEPGAADCGPIMVSTTAVNGEFTADIPLTSAVCIGYFDGDDIYYDVVQGGETLASNVHITPVPHARFADQAGVNNDCPVGYTLDSTASPGLVCARALTLGAMVLHDEVVKVGTGATAFWIDRYEATIWTASGDLLLNVRTETDLGPLGLPRNGEWNGRVPQLFARSFSVRDLPSRWITWFQAEELCRASGKRLPMGHEWLTAARNTGGSSGEAGCQITGTEPRDVAGGSACVSAWGVRDMVGNVWEWTMDWYAGTVGAGNAFTSPMTRRDACNSAAGADCSSWPSGYGGDATWNITGGLVATPGEDRTSAIPAAVLRGGSWNDGPRAGRFATNLDRGPSFRAENIGFRCVIPR